MSEDGLKPLYDDQVDEEAYKRGSQYKWTKARKSDYNDGSNSNGEAPPEKKVYVCDYRLKVIIKDLSY